LQDTTFYPFSLHQKTVTPKAVLPAALEFIHIIYTHVERPRKQKQSLSPAAEHNQHTIPKIEKRTGRLQKMGLRK
jgi:hypothetical protein